MNVSVVTYFEVVLNGASLATTDDEQEARNVRPDNGSVFAVCKTVVDRGDEVDTMINKKRID